MKAFLMSVGLLGIASGAFAAEVALPARVGETEASVKQRLGEPTDTFYDDMMGAIELIYKHLGANIAIDERTGAVGQVTVLGNYHDGSSSSYTGGIIDGLGIGSNLDQFIQKFGPSETSRNFEGSTRHRWRVDGCILEVAAWDADNVQNGVKLPKGSLLAATMFDPEFDMY